jgi:DNA polymerase-3 subunit epsilon
MKIYICIKPIFFISFTVFSLEASFYKKAAIHNFSAFTTVEISKRFNTQKSLPPISDEINFQPLSVFKQLNRRIIALDIEATGSFKSRKKNKSKDHLLNIDSPEVLKPEKNKITEIGCVEIINNRITGKLYHRYLNPERKVTPRAHWITGLTWGYLKKYPIFKEISKELVEWLKDSTLLIHDSQLEEALLKQEFRDVDIDYDIAKKHAIIDTLKIGLKEAASKKNSLNALAERYNVSLKERVKHGALIDAKILANIFLKMHEKSSHLFNVQLPDYKKDNFSKNLMHVSPLNGSKGESYFRLFGLTSELPNDLYYSEDFYNPLLKEYFPSLIVPFWDHKDRCCGVYTRYLIAGSNKIKSSKIFYGSSFGGVLDILKRKESTILIGRLIFSLIAKDILESHQNIIQKHHLDPEFSIKACFDLSDLSSISLDPKLEHLIILADQKEDLTHITKHINFLNQGKYPLLIILTLYHDISQFTLIAHDKTWLIISDVKAADKRNLTLRIGFYDVILTINKQNIVKLNGKVISDPQNFHVRKKPIKVNYIMPDIDRPILSAYKMDREKIISEFNHLQEVKPTPPSNEDKTNYSDKLTVLKTKHYNDLYSKTEIIDVFSPVSLYFRGLGVSSFPDHFKYMSKDKHPYFETELTSLVIPIYKESTITGLVKFFCNEDGTCFKENYRGDEITPYWKHGDIEGSLVTLLEHSSENPPLLKDNKAIILSNSLENALIIKDLFSNLNKIDQAHLSFNVLRNYSKISIKYFFNVCEKGAVHIDEDVSTVFLLSSSRKKDISIKDHLDKKNIKTKIVYLVDFIGAPMDLTKLYFLGGEKNIKKIAETIFPLFELPQD